MSSKPSASSSLPHWDLSNVYPSLESDAFSQAVDELKIQLNDLDNYLETHQIASGATPSADAVALAEVIGGYLDRTNATLRLYRTLLAYVYAFVTTDSYNTTARRLQSELEMLGVRNRKQALRFQGWVGCIADILPRILEQEGSAREHAFYLQELAEQSQYLMSDAEESLAAELVLSGADAWEKEKAIIDVVGRFIKSLP